jgi:hypothetical protein
MKYIAFFLLIPFLSFSQGTINCDCGQNLEIIANPTSGVTYEWSDGSTVNPFTITGLVPGDAGNYVVTVTDCNGSTDTESVEVVLPPPAADILPSFFGGTDLSINGCFDNGIGQMFNQILGPNTRVTRECNNCCEGESNYGSIRRTTRVYINGVFYDDSQTNHTPNSPCDNLVNLQSSFLVPCGVLEENDEVYFEYFFFINNPGDCQLTVSPTTLTTNTYTITAADIDCCCTPEVSLAVTCPWSCGTNEILFENTFLFDCENCDCADTGIDNITPIVVTTTTPTSTSTFSYPTGFFGQIGLECNSPFVLGNTPVDCSAPVGSVGSFHYSGTFETECGAIVNVDYTHNFTVTQEMKDDCCGCNNEVVFTTISNGPVIFDGCTTILGNNAISINPNITTTVSCEDCCNNDGFDFNYTPTSLSINGQNINGQNSNCSLTAGDFNIFCETSTTRDWGNIGIQCNGCSLSNLVAGDVIEVTYNISVNPLGSATSCSPHNISFNTTTITVEYIIQPSDLTTCC